MAPASHPKHEKLYAALAARAEALPDGCAFPSARELMAEFGVSQFTVSRAVGKLQAQGLVRSAVGSGTVVCHGRRGRGKRLALVTPDWRSAAVCEFDAAFVAGAAARGWTVAEVRYPVA
ncbi:MAG: GntR family transcriptional regulator, partial [Planctomycetes bacterium]|nr:GntR family transcriptional regulator [Planctomycetota bacterium]